MRERTEWVRSESLAEVRVESAAMIFACSSSMEWCVWTLRLSAASALGVGDLRTAGIYMKFFY